MSAYRTWRQVEGLLPCCRPAAGWRSLSLGRECSRIGSAGAKQGFLARVAPDLQFPSLKCFAISAPFRKRRSGSRVPFLALDDPKPLICSCRGPVDLHRSRTGNPPGPHPRLKAGSASVAPLPSRTTWRPSFQIGWGCGVPSPFHFLAPGAAPAHARRPRRRRGASRST